MKKLFSFLLALTFVVSQMVHAQNVGIGTTTPADKLTVQTATGNYGLSHTDGTVTVGTYVGGGLGWLGTKSGHPLAFFTNGGDPQLILGLNGFLGMGGVTPNYNLDIYSPTPQINLNSTTGGAALLSCYNNRLEIQPSTAFQVSVGTVGNPHFYIGHDGNVGIGTTSPLNRLQIGTTPGFGGNDLAIGNGMQSMSFTQSAGASTWYSSVNFSLMPNGGNGFVGIGTQSPANFLQIGSVGATGYSGNQISFGNGTQASAFNQTAGVAEWYSTSNIALMPLGTGHGRVGINTLSPGYPLEVDDFNTASFGHASFGNEGEIDCQNCTAQVSIRAAGAVWATEFDASSDVRIKDIKDISNTAEDLETVNAIQVTDYTLKDKEHSGDRPFKKIIAQQVESVYPQIVSRRTDFIPNVYQATSTITLTDKGVLLHFNSPHHISKEATKLKLQASGDNVMNKYDIISIPSDKDVLIDAHKLNGDKVLVYGEEVNDFRTVDYDGLTTLNISATQELSKLIRQQQATFAEQNEKIAALTARLESLLEDVKALKQKN